MASAGIDAVTGQVLTDFDHVLQSVGKIFTTGRGARLMERSFGAGLPELLGKLMSARLVGVYITILSLAIRLWEPRLLVVQVRSDGNTVENVRLGELAFEVLAYYRPNALDGDFTIEGGLRRVGVAANDNSTGLIVVERLAA